jgi:tRNA-dihydrouridine synthase B
MKLKNLVILLKIQRTGREYLRNKIMKNFWQKLYKPIYALAPMAGITDSAFRQVCKGYGADVVYSEMVSATALFYYGKDRKSKEGNVTMELMKYNKAESPFVVQLFGSNPEHFALAAKIITEKIKPQGIDINFGCPVQKVAKQKAGAELFKDLALSRKVIEAVIKSTDLPVSIKTRAKVGNVGVLEFLDNIKDLDVKALMIHGRTFKQGFNGPIDCDVIRKARDYFGGVILANGGVGVPGIDHDQDKSKFVSDYAKRILDETGADGIGIGQGALGRPWIFKCVRTGQSLERSTKAVFKEALEHAQLNYKLKGDQGIIEMRKHLCWYIQGLPGARVMRQKLVYVNNLAEIREIFRKYNV